MIEENISRYYSCHGRDFSTLEEAERFTRVYTFAEERPLLELEHMTEFLVGQCMKDCEYTREQLVEIIHNTMETRRRYNRDFNRMIGNIYYD